MKGQILSQYFVPRIAEFHPHDNFIKTSRNYVLKHVLKHFHSSGAKAPLTPEEFTERICLIVPL